MTSLKIDLQRLAMRLLREHLSAASPLGVNDAAIVIIENSTGAVRALACSGDPRRASLNSAIEPRSCGSALKPFLYLAAIDQRKLTAASLLPDTPMRSLESTATMTRRITRNATSARCECVRLWAVRSTSRRLRFEPNWGA